MAKIGTNKQTLAREEWRHATAGVLAALCAGAGLRAGRGVVTTVSIVTRTLDLDHTHTGTQDVLSGKAKEGISNKHPKNMLNLCFEPNI